MCRMYVLALTLLCVRVRGGTSSLKNVSAGIDSWAIGVRRDVAFIGEDGWGVGEDGIGISFQISPRFLVTFLYWTR